MLGNSAILISVYLAPEVPSRLGLLRNIQLGELLIAVITQHAFSSGHAHIPSTLHPLGHLSLRVVLTYM